MLPWLSCTAIFASSTSIWMNCSSSAKFGWIILSATYFSKPGDALRLGEVNLGHSADGNLANQSVRTELALSHAVDPGLPTRASGLA
jgi:hypothetical protein